MVSVARTNSLLRVCRLSVGLMLSASLPVAGLAREDSIQYARHYHTLISLSSQLRHMYVMLLEAACQCQVASAHNHSHLQ